MKTIMVVIALMMATSAWAGMAEGFRQGMAEVDAQTRHEQMMDMHRDQLEFQRQEARREQIDDQARVERENLETFKRDLEPTRKDDGYDYYRVAK